MADRYIDVAYEDKDIIVVNKPSGILVAADPDEDRGGEGKRRPTLTDNVVGYLLRKFKGARGAFSRPLHRLDRDTTGLVLFAKSKAALKLVDDIKKHLVRRRYLAVAEGAIEREDGEIVLPLEKGDFGHGRKVAAAKEGEGKPCETFYHVVERYENATLARVQLKTGFTHQIRVHLAAIGHPIVGDKVYNPHGRIRFHRQALHAFEVVFTHPVTKKKIEARAEIPKDMAGLIDRLRGV